MTQQSLHQIVLGFSVNNGEVQIFPFFDAVGSAIPGEVTVPKVVADLAPHLVTFQCGLLATLELVFHCGCVECQTVAAFGGVTLDSEAHTSYIEKTGFEGTNEQMAQEMAETIIANFYNMAVDL